MEKLLNKGRSGLARVGAIGTALIVPVLAHAQSTDAVTAITTAKTDALAVAGALVAMGVAVWGGMFLYRKFFK